MSVKIAHASIDENGNIAGGKVGDQTKKEICIRDWYAHKSGWNVYLECTDKALASAAVVLAKEIALDPNYGYDQSQRLTGVNSIKANDGEVDGGKGEFDCSSFVSSVYYLAGLHSLSVANTTKSLRKALLKTGKFVEYTDSSHLKSSAYAKKGGIYLSEGHHVVLVVSTK